MIIASIVLAVFAVLCLVAYLAFFGTPGQQRTRFEINYELAQLNKQP